ncbi:sugar ABC transporter substrate-binding protein [Bifidobacterium sp. SO4]|uniref:ABC transporter substrate-binding protein n=1 Tax=Bifidobacterium sp. SO4 TaxID=2809030 RepID=UPI001BDC572B|nr:sugar ABC transporter substrate-binding protein [Bifidobacterium sp. SO4]MBT1170631.1 sugar ABC transporter substrate-binding protein [Bifidobacterium sp. SO4]
MKNLRKVVASMVAAGTLLAMAACGSTQSKTVEVKPLPTPEAYGVKLENLDSSGTLKGQYGGVKITVATRTGDFEEALKEAAKYFEAVSGAEVTVQSFPPGNDVEKIQLDLSTSKTFDAVLMPVANMHSYAASGFLKKIDDFKDVADPDLDLDDFIPSVLDLYGKYQGDLYAFPYKPDSQIFFYRKDVFEDKAIQEKYKEDTGSELKVPTTNEEMIAIADYFTKSKNPDSPVEYGYLSQAYDQAGRLTWMNRAGQYGQTVTDAQNNVTVDNENTKKAMQDVLKLQKDTAPQWLQLGWDEANKLFADGKALMMEQWPGLYATVNADGSQVKDKIGFAVTPGGAPVLGGWSIAVTSSSKNAEAAYKFIEFATSKDAELLKIDNTMDPCRQSNFTRGTVGDNPQYPVLLESLSKGRQLADVDVPYVSSKANDILENQTQALLSGKQDIDTTVENMQTQIEAEVAKIKK